MSESTTSPSPLYPTNLADVQESWNRIGDAVNRASELYLKELSAYLGWARNLQREVLEQTLTTARELSRVGERQLAFAARLRDSIPVPGAVPKGTETIAGMVEGVVSEATHEA
jgi:hypothetical protein